MPASHSDIAFTEFIQILSTNTFDTIQDAGFFFLSNRAHPADITPVHLENSLTLPACKEAIS